MREFGEGGEDEGEVMEVRAGEGGVVVAGRTQGLEFGGNGDGGGEGCAVADYAGGAAVVGGEGVDGERRYGRDGRGSCGVVYGGNDGERAKER